MIQTLRISFIALVLATLSACGGGGGGGTPTAKTTPTPITVIDGYIQGAIVCVDKNKNGSCDTGETQGKTGADGKVVLDIPLDDVGKYPIVAYVPADAIDSDNPSAPVGKAYTMSASADQSAIVSPLSTLVQRLLDKDGKTTAQATAQIKRTVGDATINYMESADAKSTRLAAKMLAKLMQDPTGLVIASNLIEAEKQAAIKDALLAKLADIRDKAQALVAPGAACATDIAAQSCQSAIALAIDSVLTTSNSGQPNPPASQTVSQTASITGASSSSTPVINSGDRTDSLKPTLSGSYSAALGTEYTVRVLDGTSDLGAATLTERSKTWTFTPAADLSPGPHSFTAVVVRNSDSAKGTASGAFTIKIGNSVGATSGSNVLDTITLSLSNLWNSVKSVVFTFSGDSGDVLDGQTSKTLTAPNSGLWSSVTTAFKTAGQKLINLVFKDQSGGTLDSTRINVELATGTVSQTASIISVKDDSTSPAVTVDDGKATKDTTPVISGSIDTQLSTDTSPFYDVVVYDNGTALTGTLTYTDSSNKKDWSFTPSSALSQGAHAFTAKVVRFDGQPGEASATRNAIVLTARPSASSTTPNVLETVTFSVNNLYSGITSVVWDLGDGSAVQSSTVSNGASSITKSYGSQGTRNVTVSYKNSQSIVLATDTLSVAVGAGSVSQTASITGVSDGSTPISSGDRTNATTLTLNGTYSGNSLGSDYSIRVTDGGTTLGTATLAADTNAKTWSFTTATLTAGSHDFKAVVERVSDGVVGTSGSPYTVKIGNSVSATSGSNVLDTITLSLSNLWNSVKSVVFTFSGDSGAVLDGQTSKTVNAPDAGAWSSVTTAFKTTGQKIINLVFKDQSGGTLDSTRINVGVVTGTVSQTASITNVQDDRSQPFVSVLEGAITSDTTPVISGTSDINTDLKDYYDVAVYDNGAATPLAGAMSYSNGKSQWTFTPAAALSATTHTFTAKVLRFDGQPGNTSAARSVVIRAGIASFAPATPKVGDSVTLTASNLSSDVSTVTWDFGDGKTLLTRPTSGSTSTSNTYTYDGNMAVTVTYKDRDARTLSADNLVLPIAPVVAAPTEPSWSASISAVYKNGSQTSIPNGGRLADGGRLVLFGVIGAHPAVYSVDLRINGESSSATGGLELKAVDGTFFYMDSQRALLNGIKNFQVRLVSKVDGKVSPWSPIYKVVVGGNNSVNLSQINAWDDFVLSVNSVWPDVRQVLVRLSDSDTDMADSKAAVSQAFPGGYSNTSFQLTNAYKTSGPKNIIVEYKDASGNSLDIDSVSLTVNPAAPITQTAKVTGLAGDLSVSGVTGKFTLNGTLSAPIGQFYSVKVYDNNAANPLPGTITFIAARNGWTFIPDAPLAAGNHVFKAVVVRPGDGATGLIQESSTITVSPSRFSKISSTGQPLSNQTANWSDAGTEAAGTQWDCVLDNTTGLTWETKTNNPNSLRYNNHSYTRYLSNKDGSGVSEGLERGGVCTGLADGKCNTEAFIKAVNDARMCGKSDWRIPSDSETSVLINLGIASKRNGYFPNNNEAYYGNISDGAFGGFQLTSDRDWYSDVPNFGPFELMLVRGDFLRTATIQTIADSGGVISNGGQPAYNSLRLSGSYSDVLGSNFKVALYDGNKRLGLVTTNDANKTWSYQLDNLAVGAHAFKVVVETSDRSAQGTPSDVYAVNANTMANASNLKPSLLESVSFWIVNTWDAVKTVVWNFGDGIAEQTANLVNNISTSVDYFFQTVGVQTVSAKLKDSSGQTIGTQSLNINVKLGTVSQTVVITDVVNDSVSPVQPIPSGSTTTNQQPLIKVTTSEALNNFYSVKIVDAATNTAITTTTVSTSGNSLTLRPANALANGSYRFKAVVSRFEGTQGTPSAEWKVQIGNYDAGFSNSGVVGANAHIGKVTVQSASLSNVASFECTIQPKPGTYSAPVKITWSKVALNSRNLISNGKADLPVYGLYANYNNTISIKAILNNNSTLNLSPVTISTPVGPSTPFDAMTVLTSRASTGRQLGYDFFLSRGTRWSPIVLDTDGNVRWAYAYADDRVFDGPFIPESSAWYDNGFLVGGRDSLGMARIQLDGSFSFTSNDSFTDNNIINFHHNMEKGKTGYLALPDTSTGGYESDVIEFNPDTGAVLKTWNLKQILSNHIRASSDTVKQLFDAHDWFHVNAAAYDPNDNGVIVSSRENFVIKLDYDTGAIRWIFGDPSKYWYTQFPSLRAIAITLEAGGIYPLGQHAVSVPEAGKLLMFNNRMRSTNQPVGASEVNGDRSLVSYYAIDDVNKTATQIWQFDHPSKVYAGYCSSAYMAADKSMLVLYAATAKRFTGVDANKNVVFDYSFAGSDFCTPAFNATPVPFGNLNFTR